MQIVVRCGVAWLVIGGAGCLDGAPEPTGRIAVPLVANGADGAAYRLPPGTRLQLVRDDYTRVVPLDGEAAFLTVEVPPGAYAPTLLDDAGHTTTWPLIRTAADGSETRVEGTLDALAPLTVADQETTALTLQFHANLAEVITFAMGAVQVDVAVDEGVASAYRIDLTGTSLDTSARVTNDAPFFSDFVPLDSVQAARISALTTSGWRATSPSTVCADVALSHDAPDAMGRLLDEAFENGAAEVLCVQQLAPQVAQLSVRTGRIGGPRTSVLGQFGALQYAITMTAFATVQADVFDGTTLRLAALALALPSGMQIDLELDQLPPGGAPVHWFSVIASGGGTATLTAL